MKPILINHSINSTHWNNFVYRSNDIVIVSWAKSGTTWCQQIVGQLVFGGDPELKLARASVWLDATWPSESIKLRLLERQQHRRFIKSHLSAEYLPRSSCAKYIYVGRDARDALWSLHNHLISLPSEIYDLINANLPTEIPELQRPSQDVYLFWRKWMENDAWPLWPFWNHVLSWWKLRASPNVLFVHFVDLKRNMESEIRRIANFLQIDPQPEKWEHILYYCSFEWMKAHPKNVLPLGMDDLDELRDKFINHGINHRWRDVLCEADNNAYEQTAVRKLGVECADWLINGGTAISPLRTEGNEFVSESK